MNAPVNLLPELRNERCTRFRFRYSECLRCSDSCPAGALTAGEEGVALDPSRCTGCSLCAAVCPTAVFSAPNLPLAAIAKPKGDTISIACAPSELDGDVRVPCLGALDAALLASLAARGVAVRLRGAGHCAQCASAPAGAERLEALIDALAAVAVTGEGARWRQPVVDGATADDGLDRRRAGRRQLFRRWMGLGAQSVRHAGEAPAAIPQSAIRHAAQFVPARRRLAEQLLPGLEELPADAGAGLVWGIACPEAGVNACTGCEACARVCPTGALKTAEEGDHWRLLASAAQCVGCGACVEACTAGAVALYHGWRPAEPGQPLHALRRYRCQDCGRYSVGAADDGCPVCRDDAAGFDAIFG